MHSHTIRSGDAAIHARCDGAASATAPTLVLAHALGTDLRLWDDMLPHLAPGLRLIRYDLRGHGRSSVPRGPYTMGALIAEAEAVCDALQVSDAVFVGASVGGLIGQGLAVKRHDLVRGLVLTGSATKIGHAKLWSDQIGGLQAQGAREQGTQEQGTQAQGMQALADSILSRWFGRDFRAGPDLGLWRRRLLEMDPGGYAGVAAAISGSDFYTTTATLRLPTLGIAGSEDGITPADLMRETLDLIPGSRFALMRRCGHLPCLEAPEAFARHLNDFLAQIGHIQPATPTESRP